MTQLATAIRLALKRKAWTQDRLAREIPISKQGLSPVIQGQRPPSVELLVKIHEKLAPAEPLGVWLLWLFREQVARKQGLEDSTISAIDDAIQKATRRLGRTLADGQGPGGRTLSGFPEAFMPLTIVCGDRREPNPKTPGDLLAYSVAITDLMFLLSLGLDEKSAIIRSDKVFVLMDEAYLKREFGQTNLLVIGSPAVNFAARLVNNSSIFQFDVARETRDWVKQVRFLRGLNDKKKLRSFWRLAGSARDLERFDAGQVDPDLQEAVKEVMGGRSGKAFMTDFRKAGFVDPVDSAVHGKATREDNDFAVISMARNPYAANDDYVAIIVGGIHGPGTALALRWLSNPDNFAKHPFGGVIEIELNPFADWASRFETASTEWQTSPGHGYTPAQVLEGMEQELGRKASGGEGLFPNVTEDELNACVDFVRHLAGSPSTTGEVASTAP